uniref:uncharacterized protein LOC120339676 n=1 Tax=Styela clava TaxID=7725 RepID=UPI00193A9432|nr:uncharacterized protein LOC120339676 [Styela clava]
MKTTSSYLLLHLFAFTLMVITSYGKFCKKINSCKCEMDDGSGIINLRSLAHPGNLPKWTLSGGDGWMYKYNPCLGYSLGINSDLAVGQASTSGSAYDLGIQSSAGYNVTDDGKVMITYSAKDGKRSSRIILECDRETRFDRLEFIGEIKITEYDMMLSSPCACPGYCDNYGLYENVAKNMSGYWENTYGGKRVIPDTPQQAKYPWSDVGTSMVALLLHDILLIVLIASCIIVFGRFKRICRGNNHMCQQNTQHHCRYVKERDDSIESGSSKTSEYHKEARFEKAASKTSFHQENEDDCENASQQKLIVKVE